MVCGVSGAGVHRHQQRLAHERRVVTFGEAPADHLAGVVVHDDADVRPFTAHPDVAHIPNPNLNWNAETWMCATRELLCRRNQLVQRRSELQAHIQNTKPIQPSGTASGNDWRR